jgi:hypothetical protein
MDLIAPGADPAGPSAFPELAHPDRPLDSHTGWLILHQAFVAAGVTGMAGSHCLRKSFCASLKVALPGDIFRLSKAMRHTNVFTTLAYISYKQEEIDRAILRA